MGFVTNRWQPVSASPGPTPTVVRYGIKINESNQTVEYLYDAAGFTPALMNTTTGVLDYGSWANTPLMTSNYPAVTTNRNYTTSISYKLNPNDYAKKEDGTSSNITSPSGDVVAVFEGGWLYTYEETVSNVKYIYIIWSNVQYDSNYQCAHRDNHKSFAIGTYVTDSSKTSRSGKNVSRTYDAAKAMKWAQLNYLYCLMMIITKSVTLFKTNLGLRFGVTISTTRTIKTGLDNNKGQFYSRPYVSASEPATNKVFHIEDLFGKANYSGGSWSPGVADISASSTNYRNSPYYITANGTTQATSSFQYSSYNSSYVCGNYVPHIFASPQGIFPTGVTRTSVSNYYDINMGNLYSVSQTSENTLAVASFDEASCIVFNKASNTGTMHISHYID